MSEKMTLTEAQRRLDAILNKMSDQTLPFEVLLNYYEEASKLLSFCYREINQNKGKFEELKDRLLKAREEEMKNV